MSAKKPVTDKVSEKIIPPARGKKTSKSDFDRNRDGLYGGLPKARDAAAPGGHPAEPHPPSAGRRGAQRRDT